MRHLTLRYFEDLFQRQYPIVLRQIIQLVGDRSVAEDLAQEVFLSLYKQPPDDLSKVGPWLHRILTRVSYDYMQKKTRQRRLDERMRFNQTALQVVHPSSEQLVLNEFDSSSVRRSLLQLSERDRKALRADKLEQNGVPAVRVIHMDENGNGVFEAVIENRERLGWVNHQLIQNGLTLYEVHPVEAHVEEWFLSLTCSQRGEDQ